MHLPCVLEECLSQWTDHIVPKIHVEKALEGGDPEGKSPMCAKSDLFLRVTISLGSPVVIPLPVKL